MLGRRPSASSVTFRGTRRRSPSGDRLALHKVVTSMARSIDGVGLVVKEQAKVERIFINTVNDVELPRPLCS